MTDAAVVEAAGSLEERVAGFLRRRSLVQHALILLLLLAALAAYMGTRSAFVTDESLVVIQLDQIEATGGWTLPHPMPSVDEEGAGFPLHGATRYTTGYTLYGKHPLLVFLYLPVHRALGLAGLIGLSVLGTAGAALAAGATAQRIRRGAGPLALWLVGAGSPLFFDSFLIHAHTIAAALAALAVYLALRIVDERRWWLGVGSIVAVFGVALLRTEGVLFAGALGGTVGLWGLLRRRPSLVLLGIAGLAAGWGARATDALWARALAGGDEVPIRSFTEATTSFVSSRLTGLTLTTLAPGYRDLDLAELATLVGAVLLVVGTVVLLRRPDDAQAVVLPALGAGLLAVRAVVGWGAVPGLLVAFCVGVAGLALVRSPVVTASATRFVFVCSAAFFVAVALSQYRVGGHTEWGGRYFALAVPLLGAVSASSIAQAFADLPRQRARQMQACLLIASLSLGVLAVRTVTSVHDRNRQRSDAVLAAAAALPPADDGLAPVVVTEDNQIPRLARGRYREARFLFAAPRYLTTYLDRLAGAGVDDVLLVSIDPASSLASLPEAYTQIGPVEPYALQWVDGGGLIRLHLAAQ